MQNNNSKFKIFLVLSCCFAFFVLSFALVDADNAFAVSTFGGTTGEDQTSIKIPNPLGTTQTFADLIAKINEWFLYIGAPILTLMIIIGAFQILTAGGVPDKITKGRKTITYAIIGYALLLLSTGIITIIENVLGAK